MRFAAGEAIPLGEVQVVSQPGYQPRVARRQRRHVQRGVLQVPRVQRAGPPHLRHVLVGHAPHLRDGARRLLGARRGGFLRWPNNKVLTER